MDNGLAEWGQALKFKGKAVRGMSHVQRECVRAWHTSSLAGSFHAVSLGTSHHISFITVAINSIKVIKYVFEKGA